MRSEPLTFDAQASISCTHMPHDSISAYTPRTFLLISDTSPLVDLKRCLPLVCQTKNSLFGCHVRRMKSPEKTQWKAGTEMHGHWVRDLAWWKHFERAGISLGRRGVGSPRSLVFKVFWLNTSLIHIVVVRPILGDKFSNFFLSNLQPCLQVSLNYIDRL